MSHTPGPWNTPEYMTMRNGNYIIRESEYQEPIAIVCAGMDAGQANARLIACAPELLQACKDFVAKVERGEARSTDTYQQMKTVIAKAEGK